jgi:predicted metalloprotease
LRRSSRCPIVAPSVGCPSWSSSASCTWAIAKHYYKGVQLQADCYTGVFSRYAEEQGLLEPGDLDEAARLMTAVGDQVRVSPTTPGAHGTAPERVFWFQVGNKTNSLAECMTVYPTLSGGKTARESRAAA